MLFPATYKLHIFGVPHLLSTSTILLFFFSLPLIQATAVVDPARTQNVPVVEPSYQHYSVYHPQLGASGVGTKLLHNSGGAINHQQQQSPVPQAPSIVGMVATQGKPPSPQPPASSMAAAIPRHLTSSNSFDSKPSQLPNFAMFHMSEEARRLFQTLQQSPLPIATHDVI